MSTQKDIIKGIAFGRDNASSEALNFLESNNISSVGKAAVYLLQNIKDTVVSFFSSSSKPTESMIMKGSFEKLKDTIKSAGEQASSLEITDKVFNSTIRPNGELTYGNVIRVGLFSTLITYSVYKLITWIKKKKEPTDIEETYILFTTTLELKEALFKNFKLRIQENDIPGDIQKTLELSTEQAKELAEFAIEENEEDESFIKKYFYKILAVIAGILAIYIFATKQKQIQNVISGFVPSTESLPYNKNDNTTSTNINPLNWFSATAAEANVQSEKNNYDKTSGGGGWGETSVWDNIKNFFSSEKKSDVDPNKLSSDEFAKWNRLYQDRKPEYRSPRMKKMDPITGKWHLYNGEPIEIVDPKQPKRGYDPQPTTQEYLPGVYPMKRTVVKPGYEDYEQIPMDTKVNWDKP